jgi:hypothetical protein
LENGLLILFGYALLTSPLHPEKAELSIEVTDLGMVIDVRLVQLLKVFFSIEVIELDKDTDVSPLQLPKAPLPIEVTEFGIET